MDPKFQSSFIPKHPAASVNVMPQKPAKQRSFFGVLAGLIFSASVVIAGGTFGYNVYLENRIVQMGEDLELATESIDPITVDKFIRLDNRISATQRLLDAHVITSPIFEFLEQNTVRYIRFSDFSYAQTADGIQLQMSGESLGYAALALQADIFEASDYFEEPTFINLRLDDRGNVSFVFKAFMARELVSHAETFKNLPASSPTLNTDITTPEATSTTATSSENQAIPLQP